MKWWKRFLKANDDAQLDGQEFRVVARLYSRDGRREVDVCEFRSAQAYLIERELRDDSVFVDRHSGKLVGPFESPEAAEQFIVATEWLNGSAGG